MTFPSFRLRRYIRPLLIIGAGVLLTAATFLYYHADHRYPPCCDTAISIMKAKEIAQTGNINPWQTYNPSFPERAYGSFFSTEIIGHLTLATLYRLHPSWAYDLVFAKNFFVVVFTVSLASLAVVVLLMTRSAVAALGTYLALFLMYWYGNSYWSGHVAEMFAFTFLAWGVYALFLWQRKKTLWTTALCLLLSLLLFFTHILAFLFFFFLAAIIIFTELFQRSQKQAYIVGGIYLLASFFYFRFTSSSQFLPTVNTSNENIFLLREMTAAVFPTLALLFVGCIGVWASIRHRRWLLIHWLAAGYVLTQSTALGAPFFASRFSVFLAPALALAIGFGLQELGKHRLPIVRMGALIVLILAIPTFFYQQEGLKQCYVRNCPGLHPTQLLQADQEAFVWMRENLPTGSTILAHQKFGYFLPIVTDHLVELPVLDKRQIFTASTAAMRSEISKKYNIRYVFWDGILAEQPGSVLEAQDYFDRPFTNKKYFALRYSEKGVKIYEVL